MWKKKPFWSLPVYSMILSIMSNHCNCLFMMQSHWTHVLILLIGDNIDTKEEKHHSTHQKHEHPFDALPSLVKCEKWPQSNQQHHRDAQFSRWVISAPTSINPLLKNFAFFPLLSIYFVCRCHFSSWSCWSCWLTTHVLTLTYWCPIGSGAGPTDR